MAEQELARVSHITRQTLGFYRESTLPTSVHIPAVVESILKLYSNKLQHKQIRLLLAFEECPPIIGLGGEIQQLVSNIISNAIDALPFNGTLKIESSLARMLNGKSIRLTIEDDGPGISPENLERIFEPFFTTKQDVGTGLGLWVCKEIAERHGGTVQAHSKMRMGQPARCSRFFCRTGKTLSATICERTETCQRKGGTEVPPEEKVAKSKSQPSAQLNQAGTGGRGDFAVKRGRQVSGWRVETYQVEGIGGLTA